MHLLVRETRALDEDEAAIDLGQTPADMVFLSFAASDLAAAARAWARLRAGWQEAAAPRLRLANLRQLRHPMSVDLYLENVAANARVIIVRLLGGLDYWRYGVEELAALCRARGIALALLAGDQREDAELAALSTVTAAALARLDRFFREGGVDNVAGALGLAAHLGGFCEDSGVPAVAMPSCGEYALITPDATRQSAWAEAAIVFYRAHLLAGDIAPIEALAAALARAGVAARLLFVDSLKEATARAFIAETLAATRPGIVLAATGFAARGEDGTPSPLEAADAPILQLVLAGGSREDWEKSRRGLAPADLAMQVVLPELDGRLLAGAISFKAPASPASDCEFVPEQHAPDPGGINRAADLAIGWLRLAATPRAERRLAIVLADYPTLVGGRAHAVGLDTLGSLAEICDLLGAGGYTIAPFAREALAESLCDAEPTPILSLAEYHALFAELPVAARERITAAWGAPEADPACVGGHFTLRHLRLGNILAAIEPDRGEAGRRKETYHDPDLPPRHGYVAFHLWLRHRERIHAFVPLGAHGMLEWLPGKAVALHEACFPALFVRGLPVIYPFIVNNPGEAVAAKRRLGALTLGHLTPPLMRAGLHGEAAALERLIDDYAAASGLDRERARHLRREILARARSSGLAAEAGCADSAREDELLAKLDAYLCDIKDRLIGDGLHVFARAPAQRGALLAALREAAPTIGEAEIAARLDASAPHEARNFLAALDGRFIPPGPAGAPSRGRVDVLPTGRNIISLDPRAIPTRAAVALAEKHAASLLEDHLRRHGAWPKRLVIDLWGSATMRTGGEAFALALVLLGARPLWDAGSHRVNGIAVLALAELDRPRIDVTLRISGLFRDAFATQIALFDDAVTMIAARDEDAAWNPLAAHARQSEAVRRIYGPAPGVYGLALGDLGNPETESAEFGRTYLAQSAFAYGTGQDGLADQAGLAARIAGADAYFHIADHNEHDVLADDEIAAHAGGFAAAAALLGASPALHYARPAAGGLRVASLAEEIAQVTRARAANPRWIAGQMRHGYRGAAEIARAISPLSLFAMTLPSRFDRQFDLLFAATLGNPDVDAFLAAANGEARRALAARFAAMRARDLWRSRRNDVGEILSGILEP